MPISKPENDEDLLKELESIENLCARALTPATGKGFNTVDPTDNPAVMERLLLNIQRRAKNCQGFVRNQLLDTNGQF